MLDPYQVKRTVLSSDGCYMAFDFHKLGADERSRTRYSVAVYDIEAETIELHVAPPPREFHSASFSPDDRFLAVIQRCWAKECSPQELGLNVGIIDRADRRFQLVTSGERGAGSGPYIIGSIQAIQKVPASCVDFLFLTRNLLEFILAFNIIQQK